MEKYKITFVLEDDWGEPYEDSVYFYGDSKEDVVNQFKDFLKERGLSLSDLSSYWGGKVGE